MKSVIDAWGAIHQTERNVVKTYKCLFSIENTRILIPISLKLVQGLNWQHVRRQTMLLIIIVPAHWRIYVSSCLFGLKKWI